MNFLSGQDDFFQTGNQPISVRHLSFVLKTYLDKIKAVGVRTGLEVPCEAFLQLDIQQRAVHRIKYTEQQS